MAPFPKSPNDEFKQYAYDQIARIGKALSSPQRLVILNILNQSDHTVEELAEFSDMTLSNVSRHLSVLTSINLVKVKRDGKYKRYSISDTSIKQFYRRLKEIAWQQLPELQTVVQAVNSWPTRRDAVDRMELDSLLQTGNAVLLDVRPRKEYEAAHVPGAISTPIEELESFLEHLPSEKVLVPYCRGSFCILADKAVEILRANGFNARRANLEVLDLELDGLPLDHGKSS